MLLCICSSCPNSAQPCKYFALLSSPNRKQRSKYKRFCTFELSELEKTQYIQLFCTFRSPNGPLQGPYRRSTFLRMPREGKLHDVYLGLLNKHDVYIEALNKHDVYLEVLNKHHVTCPLAAFAGKSTSCRVLQGPIRRAKSAKQLYVLCFL